ncbi:hypothetical protein ALI144C_07560 [Actinosynnema sp. ALI-1.44]|uniref:non-ribosomal peptide synthetase n=1 Tax=Actinosynnema sp. ALI-1.44 TaxID=1933779 RepID=UPI00097BE0F9|nr:non-ribosomal peptide synthetase [Actinosynnema sp. ALI-1.44]ONI88283.1 hypothetical protein ALI144C_07560 [Actinosynnema sp. ALI-1.44]
MSVDSIDTVTDDPAGSPADWPGTGPTGEVGTTVRPKVAGGLAALAARQDTTVSEVLLTVLEVLVNRHTGQSAVVVGTVRSGAVAITTREVGPDMPFTELMGGLRVAHESPVDVLFGHESDRVADEIYPAAGLTVWVADRADRGIDVRLTYATALFRSSTPQRMADHFQRLLASAVRKPSTPVGRLPILPACEQRWLLEAADGERRPRTAACLHDLVTAQAVRRPAAVAVIDRAGRHTYRELDDRSSRLAHHLRAHGIRPESVVAVCQDRGFDLVVSLLAVLKAGGAYLPLDPEHPVDRLEWMIADCAPAAVLTSSDVLGECGAPVIRVDRTDLTGRSRIAPVSGVGPANLAYVVYTSGSTGRPKGVAATHAGIRNRVLWAVDELGLGETDRVLQKTTISFDAAGWEILAPLVAGGTVVAAPPGAQRDPVELVRLTAHHRITVAQYVPSVLAQVVAEPGLTECTALRMVFSAGEALPASLADQLLRRTGALLYNTYGPTECSIDATAKRCGIGEPGPVVSIGAPLSNTRVLVLDQYGNLVPVGVPGELHIGGVGVARGYVGRPALTAERFVPDPYAADEGSRLYRTGDLVRWRADGMLEFLGRLDRQVKINGVRVEPGEIEGLLREHPEVRAAAVKPWDTGDGLTLVGYVAATPATDMAAIRAFADSRLPKAMVPAVYVRLDEFPQTANGKLDYAQLPAPSRRTSGAERVAPRDATELVVARIWSEVLGPAAGDFGVHDDFLSLGGHSLLVAKVAARLRQAVGVDIPFARVFNAPTIAELARVVATAPQAASEAPVPVDRSGRLPLSPAQQQLWLLDRLNPAGREYLLPVALRLTGVPDVPALRQAFTGLVRRHEILRTRYEVHGTDVIQVVDAPGAFPLRTIDLSGMTEDSALAALRSHAEQGFDLEREHPVRAVLAKLAETDHVLLIVVHHIAGDGWSMDPMARDLAQSYQAAVEGRDPSPAPLPVQYSDFTVWQRKRSTATSVAYWRDALADVQPLLLPTDRPRPAVQDTTGERHGFTIPAALAAVLAELGQTRQATPFMTLLAVFKVLLARYSGQFDVAVGVPVARRDLVVVEQLIGHFVNTIVLRSRLDARGTFESALELVRDNALTAYGHQDHPFEQLVAELAPDRDLSRNPLFQVMFQVHDETRTPFSLTGLDVRPCTVAPPAAIVDLALALERRPDGAWYGEFEYATALFDASTVQRMAENFVRLITEITAQDGTPISDLDLLGAGERTLLAAQFDDKRPRAAECLHRLVSRQAAETPDAPAVRCGAGNLTYSELEQRANQLAGHLIAAGARIGDVVAVAMDRDGGLVVALLAVLKVGGVYLPIDPQDPPERLTSLTTRTDVRFILTRHQHAARLRPLGAPVVDVDAERERIAARPAVPPDVPVRLGDLAYVIHTSGSTGRPKAVMVEHRSFVEHCAVMAGVYRMRPGTRVALMASTTFDASMDQIAAPLISGAAVVMVDLRASLPDEMLDRLTAEHVNVIDVTPVYYRELLDHLKPGDGRLAELELMSVGGDVVTFADAARWAATGLPAGFACTYGPTEATIASTYHLVTAQELAGCAAGRFVPLGRGLIGTPLYVLDERMNPVPTGVAGELYIGGSRVARGYFGQPGMTADRFPPDPFSAEPGARMYRTGDRVRSRADGVVEFFGRVDRQVKIRGFRIEPGEVEATLAGHPDVGRAAVVAKQSRSGDHVLVGYVVPRDPAAAPDIELVREFLGSRLPAHLVPSYLVMLTRLPVTQNGKVDRDALPEPDVGATGDRPKYEPPRDEIERRVAEIWQELMGIAEIGVHDDFFRLGGHSLLATRVCLLLRRDFGVSVGLRAFMRAATVAGVAGVVRDEMDEVISALSEEEVDALLGADERDGHE